MADRPGSTSMWIFAILCFVAFALGLTIVTKDYVMRSSIREAQNIEAELGPSTLARINDMAGRWYLMTLDRWVDNGSLRDWLSEDPAQRTRERWLIEQNSQVLKWAEERKAAFLDLGFWVMRRVALFLIWLPLWIPLAVLATYHGLLDREIKKTDFGYTSPVLNHWARRVMHMVTMVTLLLFLSPVALDPLVFPLMMGFWSIAVGIAFANIQKRI